MTTESAVRWTLTEWRALTADALYDALALRQRVFVIEQRCIYLDCDGRDRSASHLFGRRPTGELVAYARLFSPGVVYPEASIGRVVTDPRSRGEGLGRALMNEAIARLHAAHGPLPIRIGAQRYLERFYEELGFVIAGEPYIEDEIPHVEMRHQTPRA